MHAASRGKLQAHTRERTGREWEIMVMNTAVPNRGHIIRQLLQCLQIGIIRSEMVLSGERSNTAPFSGVQDRMAFIVQHLSKVEQTAAAVVGE